MQNKKKSIFPLLWVMLFDHTCLNITFPVLTLLFFDAQSSLFPEDTSHTVRSMWYGLCVAVPHIVNIFITPLLSALSDEFGRKKLLLLGTFGAFLFAITSALGIIGGLLSVLMLGFILKGMFSRTNPIAQAVIGDISERETKVLYMGYLQTSISIGAFIGPIIGGYFANQFFFKQLNFSLPFLIAAIFALISCILTLYLFEETHTEKRQHASWQDFHYTSIKKVFLNPNVWRISVILLLSQISWSIYYQYMPPILKTVLHFDAHTLGIFIGLIALWLALATSFGIKLLQTIFELSEILLFSLYLVLIGTLLSFVFCYLSPTGLWTYSIWFAAIPTAVGDVIAYSCLTALYSDAVHKTEQGKVMAICFIVISLIWALTGILGGMLMSAYTLLPLLIAPIGILFCIGMMHSRFGKRMLDHQQE